MIHYDLPQLISGFVDRKLLFDLDGQTEGILPCQIFSLAAYAQEALTFQILLEDGSLFSYVPLHLLYHKPPEAINLLELEDLVYHNCPDSTLCIHRFERLSRDVVNCFFKRKQAWLVGDYIFTMDWYCGNDLLHFIQLHNGQFALLPNHKVKFLNGDPHFQPFKKLHAIWKV
ncbi:hypothetical protein V2H45_12975 [Tumidithrix elongata RA019]|uniref:Uncharacterized protein n=1 Tax=Tumidithrix elongata BACA0141 TaxID=2716417 RepID=A0AAW9Q437_9CYAN|nr:hypothetical protein [Tumidithrix elongata RA019]